MTIRRADTGAVLSKAQLDTLTTDAPDPDPEVVVPVEIWQDYTIGEGVDPDPTFEQGRRILFYAGQVVKQSMIDGLFPAADITSVSPAGGGTAGGTAVTIKGTNFAGATAVTFGGTAATNVVVQDNETITCTAPAHSAGAVNVVVADDGGNVTEASAFTYA